MVEMKNANRGSLKEGLKEFVLRLPFSIRKREKGAHDD